MEGRKKKERWIKHYKSSQKILFVGEGDFSFSACLARAFRSAVNMVATSLHSEDTLLQMHWTSEAHLDELKRLGCLVLHEIDAYDMNKDPTLRHIKFDVIVFNFPHAGHYYWLCEKDEELIQMHKELLEAFFKSASQMLSKGGEVHVTHRDDYPYNTWNIVMLAKKSGLHLKEKAEFQKEDYPGYHNKRGGDINSNKTFPLNQCYTFKFTLNNVESTLEKSDECETKDIKRVEIRERTTLNNVESTSVDKSDERETKDIKSVEIGERTTLNNVESTSVEKSDECETKDISNVEIGERTTLNNVRSTSLENGDDGERKDINNVEIGEMTTLQYCCLGPLGAIFSCYRSK